MINFHCTPSSSILNSTETGLHLKTAGTTWLEELIGLAEAGGDEVQLVRDVYRYAIEHREELCEPYATVIDIDPDQLLSVEEFDALSGPDTAATIRHIQDDTRLTLMSGNSFILPSRWQQEKAIDTPTC